MAEYRKNGSEIVEEPVNRNPVYTEEMAADVVPITNVAAIPEYERPHEHREEERPETEKHVERSDSSQAGRVMGMFAVILSLLSLFIVPVLMGAAGIILGFVAVRRGAATSGYWAIGIGIASIVISLIFAPFF